MFSIWFVLTFVHLVGLSIGVGAATVKLTLLIKSRVDHDFIPTYIKITRPITRIIITGLVLLTLSGAAWIIQGTTLTPLLILKLFLVLVIWVLGPIIDNAIEPKYVKYAPVAGDQASQEFKNIQKKLLIFETAATLDFYIIILLGILI